METTSNTTNQKVEMQEKKEEKCPRELTVEQMLPYIGEFGIYQKLLVVSFALVIFATSMQPVLCTFFTLTPTWSCKENNTMCPWNGTHPGKDTRRCNISRTSWYYNEEKQFSIVTQFGLDCERSSLKTLLMSIFFVGWMVGAIVCGSAADRFGRRVTFIPCLATIFVLGFVSPFVNNVVAIVVFRFFIGAAFPGLLIQGTVLITEFTGTSIRPFATGVVSGMFNVAWVVLGVKANYLRNWKYLSIVCTAPYVFTLLFYFFIPESVRWLHLNGRNQEAMVVLRNIAKWNKRILPDDVTLPSNSTKVTVHRPKSNLVHLFKTRVICVQTCVIMFVWLATALQSYGLQFAANDLGGGVYLNFILLSAAGLPAAVVAAISVRAAGRKVSTLSAISVGSITCFVIAVLPNNAGYKIARLVLGILGKFFGIATFACLYVWSPEIYSTNMRAAAMGIVQLSARVGSGLSPVVVNDLKEYGGWIPFVILGVVSLTAAGLGLLLPESKGKQLKEDSGND